MTPMRLSNIKNLFDKYVVIWVWSIFVTINTTLSYNIFTFYSGSQWGKLSTFTIPFVILAAMLALTSWNLLFSFFKIKILDLILPGLNTDEQRNNTRLEYLRQELEIRKSFRAGDDDKHLDHIQSSIIELEEEILHKTHQQDSRAYKDLQNSFRFIIYAVAARFLMSIIEAILSSFFSSTIL